MLRFTLLLAVLAPAAFAQSEIWLFDDLNRIGGHAVMVEGDPQVIDTPLGKAIKFDGVEDALFLDVHPLAGAETFTWEAIFRPRLRWRRRATHLPLTGERLAVAIDV